MWLEVNGQGSQKVQRPGWLGPTMSKEEEEVGGAGAGAGDMAASGEKEEASGESPERTLR